MSDSSLTVELPSGISIDYVDVGATDGPVALLVMGLGAQRVAWPDDLVTALVDGGARVVAYDNRDIGSSTWLVDAPVTPLPVVLAGAASGNVPEPPYTLADMAGDGIALLDHLGIEQAHVVGASMGGMIVQRMAIHHPARVASLTSIMSTTGDPLLPGPTPAAAQALMTAAPTDDRQTYVDAAMKTGRVLGSTTMARDEDAVAERLGTSFDRGINPQGFLRQYHAILADGDRTAQLGDLDIPTVVVHGSADPLIPPAAGTATAAAIPGSRLEILEGMGHDLPPAACVRIAELVIGLTSL